MPRKLFATATMPTLEETRLRFSRPGALEEDTKEACSSGSTIREILAGFEFKAPLRSKNEIIQAFGIPRDVAFKNVGPMGANYTAAINAFQKSLRGMLPTMATAGRAMATLGAEMRKASAFEQTLAEVKDA